MSKEKYECGQCGEPATQAWEVDGGVIARCDEHEVPHYDVGSAWHQVLPAVKK